ncbi:unnamed protein product [Paramecium sonneborni]|uniref:Uncharacterized protein n=1 Tax=Paramecium sonneborni TaxID=65129 RepID=A0A8S1R087_9CILI|nr:unnamed protein product [Paramecium sonneborni]
MSLKNKGRKQNHKHKTNIDEEGIQKKDFSIILRTKWTPEEDQNLIAYVSLYGHRWLMVAQQMEQRNASQCCQRWKKIKKSQGFQTYKAKRWTQNEDQTLLRIFKEVGPSWNTIARQMINKTGKQVRRRFKNVLDPNLNHSPMTEDEDQRIYQEYLKNGPQWSKISEKMTGRSENMVKNRFYTYIKEKYLNQPNPYFKVKPYDEINMGEGLKVFLLYQNSQFKHELYEQFNQDLYNDSNQIIDNNQQSCNWSIESKGQILKNLK